MTIYSKCPRSREAASTNAQQIAGSPAPIRTEGTSKHDDSQKNKLPVGNSSFPREPPARLRTDRGETEII